MEPIVLRGDCDCSLFSGAVAVFAETEAISTINSVWVVPSRQPFPSTGIGLIEGI